MGCKLPIIVFTAAPWVVTGPGRVTEWSNGGADMVPYSNLTVVEAKLALTVAFNCAPEEEIPVAALVATVGARGTTVTEISSTPR